MFADLSTYLVTDTEMCGDTGVAETVRQAVSAGVRVVQLRDKSASDEAFTAQLIELANIIAGRALLLANDRLDVVLAARAGGARVDGVHLGQSDRSVAQARAALGPNAIIGHTAYSRAHFDAVRALPKGTVDYLGVGAIAATKTKSDHAPVIGTQGFADLIADSPLPCVAIGGIGPDHVGTLRQAGAAGVAVSSAICGAANPYAATADLVQRWRRGGTPGF